MSLLDLVRQAATDLSTTGRGALYQANPFDHGKTWANRFDPANHRAALMASLAHGRWSGVPGGDQELIPNTFRGVEHMPQVHQLFDGTAPSAHSSLFGLNLHTTPAFQRPVMPVIRSPFQPGGTPPQEDQVTGQDVAQPVDYNTHQTSLSGLLMQPSLYRQMPSGPINLQVRP